MRVERHEFFNKELSKRTYLPFTVYSRCPICGHECFNDLSDSYLSYPVPGDAYKIYFNCGEDSCNGNQDHEYIEWEERVFFDVTIEPAKIEEPKSSKWYQNWSVHNIIGHPVSEICNLLGFREMASRIHDATVPVTKEGE